MESKRGGKREGSGRKNKYGEKLIKVSVTKLVPESQTEKYKQEVRKKASEVLKSFEILQIKT